MLIVNKIVFLLLKTRIYTVKVNNYKQNKFLK